MATVPAVTASIPAHSTSFRSTQPKTPGIGVQLLTAGCAACIADLATFPLDTAKVRLQIQGEAVSNAAYDGIFGTLRTMSRQEGVASLYSGLVPGLQRQMAMSAIRIGAYESVKDFYQQTTGISSGIGLLFVRICAGITTGTLAILVAQPTDVVKIRMQADALQPYSGDFHRQTVKRYSGVFHAYSTIATEEGIRGGLYRGIFPNIARNSIINVGEIVVYDAMKDGLISGGVMKDGIPCHFVSALMAGFTATVLASPVDVIKTRYMNSPEGMYRGAIHCATETAKREGLLAFYKGFNASYTRLASWNIVLWLTYEQFKTIVKKHY